MSQSLAKGLRACFTSTYFSEDPSVYLHESEGVSQEAAPAAAPEEPGQTAGRDGPGRADCVPLLQPCGKTGLSESRGDPKRKNFTGGFKASSARAVNLARLARQRQSSGHLRPQSRTQEAKMLKAAIAASRLD